MTRNSKKKFMVFMALLAILACVFGANEADAGGPGSDPPPVPPPMPS